MQRSCHALASHADRHRKWCGRAHRSPSLFDSPLRDSFSSKSCAAFVELSSNRPHHFRTVPVPPEYTALEKGTRNGILAEYPLGYSDIYRLWQRIHGRPLVNGAPEGSLADEAHLMVLDPKEPGTASELSLPPRPEGKRTSSGPPRRSFSHERRTLAVTFSKGVSRLLRPLPRHLR